ncbi:C-X-C chemokine receptor type 2 [Diretmus argenteus]
MVRALGCIKDVDKSFVFDLDYFDELLNASTLPPNEGDLVHVCSQTVHGLSSVGLMVAFIIVFVLSTLGNGVVVYVVYYMERDRHSTDVYLMHLALADLIFSVTLPFWALRERFGWVFGNFLCKLLSGLQEASVYSGVFLLACISVDRYFAIVRATRILSSRRHLVGLVCSAVWLAAAVLSLPVTVQREAMERKDLHGHFICYENLTGESSDHWRVSMRVLRHTLGFFLPLVVMVFCYSCTVATLQHSRNKQKYKAMRVILAVVLAFVLCWLPHNVTVLVDTLMRGGSLGTETCAMQSRVALVLSVTQAVAFMHCAVNPMLYAFIGQKFRNQLLVALHKHGVISKRVEKAFRKGSGSTGSLRSRNTSVTL